jgi:CelD/BcsL family acetyltransferase involved in cellulose biosynthesis
MRMARRTVANKDSARNCLIGQKAVTEIDTQPIPQQQNKRAIEDVVDRDPVILNPAEDQTWDGLLLSHPGYTFFHSSAWAKVLVDTYHYQPLYFVLRQGRQLVFLLPLMEVSSWLTRARGVSLPFTDYCEPLGSASVQMDDVLRLVKDHMLRRRWAYLEIRGGTYPGIPPSVSYYVHTVELSTDPEAVFSRFSNSTKRNIKKAIRTGTEARMYKSLEALTEFYALHCITRKRHGLPPQPFSFFQNIYEHIISKGLGFVVLTSYAHQNIAGAVYFGLGRKSVYKFAASDLRYQYLRPNNLTMWEAIKWYAENGYRSMCLGRTAVSNQGLRRFKNGWGAQEQILRYYRYDVRHNIFVSEGPVITSAYRWVFGAMPRSWSRAVGSLLYKHVG